MSVGKPIVISKSLVSLPEPFPEFFIDNDVSIILEDIIRTIDIPFRKSESVPKTILVDCFGTQKAGKTKTTEKIEQVFRRHKFNVFCPPETAEIEEVRNKLTDNPAVSQAIHLTGVQDYVLNLAQHPRFHLAIISRGLIDMLYWYERDRRKGVYSDIYCNSIRSHVYELLRMDLVDAFIFFTCSVEAAMKREYSEALTQKRGSKMNEKDVAETINIYNAVLEGVNENVPGLPIFHVDTSDLGIKEVGQEVLRFLLPVVCRRFSVSAARFIPNSPTLIRRQAKLSGNIEEQLKLKGHPSREKLNDKGWRFEGTLEQEDTYLSLGSDTVYSDGIFDEILRIRKDNLGLRFMYKGQAEDRWFSCRRPLTFHIDHEEVERICKLYPVILSIKKTRECYELDRIPSDNHADSFTVHIDTIDGLGSFTEIRARGFSDKSHTEELRNLAEELGFGLSDVVEGSYLSIALKNK